MEYISSPSTLEHISSFLVEPTITDYKEPLNLSKDFWWTGNTYFYNCIKFGFRRGVAPYLNASQESRESQFPLYSSYYYGSLERMSNEEITELFENNPIEVENNNVVSGKHRVFAMIGLIYESNSYIPVKVRRYKKIF